MSDVLPIAEIIEIAAEITANERIITFDAYWYPFCLFYYKLVQDAADKLEQTYAGQKWRFRRADGYPNLRDRRLLQPAIRTAILNFPWAEWWLDKSREPLRVACYHIIHNHDPFWDWFDEHARRHHTQYPYKLWRAFKREVLDQQETAQPTRHENREVQREREHSEEMDKADERNRRLENLADEYECKLNSVDDLVPHIVSLGHEKSQELLVKLATIIAPDKVRIFEQANV